MALTTNEISAIRKLIEAAKPFTSGETVTETSGTIPLMEELEDAIEAAEAIFENAEEE
jgi:hypothetical protein